jgi:hypothetical protein
MDDSDPAWPPALARNSRLSTPGPSARSPLHSGPITGSAHLLIGPPAPDRPSLPLPLCLCVCALTSRARFPLSFSLPCPVMLPPQCLACMITPGRPAHSRPDPGHSPHSRSAQARGPTQPHGFTEGGREIVFVLLCTFHSRCQCLSLNFFPLAH